MQCCSASQPAVCLMLSSGVEIILCHHTSKGSKCSVSGIRGEVSPEQELRAQGVVGSDSRRPGHPVGMALVVILRGSTVEFLPQSCESSVHTRVCPGIGHPDVTNFGKSNFGHLFFGPANLGQNQFWPTIQVWPIHCWIWCVSWPQKVEPEPRKNRAPKVEAPKGGGPKGWAAQKFALFSHVPPPCSLLLSLSGFSWNFGGV